MSLNNCDNCKEMIILLSNYNNQDGCKLLDTDDLNLLTNYINLWSTSHCGCCYKDVKNFQRFNNLMQCVLQTSFSLLKFIQQCSINPNSNLAKHSSFNKWNIEDKEKLLIVSSKGFQLTFPLYVIYKHSNRNEELLQKELRLLSNYCDFSDYEMPVFLMRRIIYFIEHSGFLLYINCFKLADPKLFPISFANALIVTIQSLKYYFTFGAINNELVTLRTQVINYLCKIQDSDLRNINNRTMFEYIWSAVKEINQNNYVIDEDGLRISYKYFTSTTLTMRLSGLAQINNYISIYSDYSSLNHIMVKNQEKVRDELTEWLIDNRIVENIFGPNSHVEVIKQSHYILNYIASKITTDHIDIIWSAAQLKHYERYIFEILCQLIKNFKMKIVCYLYGLLWKIEPKDHSEHTLNLASNVIKYIWLYNGIQPDIITCSTSYLPNDKLTDLDKNSFMSSLFKDRTEKTNSSSASSIEVSDEDEEDFDVTINNQQICSDKTQISKLNSEDCSNNTSESEFDMEICNNIYDKQESFLKISDSSIDDTILKNDTEDNSKDSSNDHLCPTSLSFSWSDDTKTNEKILSKRINSSENDLNKMEMDLLLEDECQIKNEPQDSPMYELSSDKMSFKDDFKVSEIYKPGNTLLWDIIQDDMLNQLNEDLAISAEKIFWNTIFCASNQEIRLKFITGCLDNISKNISVITSIKLLQKLFNSFHLHQDMKFIRKIISDFDKQKNMLKCFFNYLSILTSSLKNSYEAENGQKNSFKSKIYSPKEEIEIRLNFLSFVFMYNGGLYENLSFSQEHLNILWNVFTFSTLPDVVDVFFAWLLSQVKLNSLDIDLIKHILFEKMPQLKPELFSLISLDLLQNLHSFTINKNCENSKTLNIVVKLLWDIAFKNPNPDVSMNASRHLNNYYLNLLNCTNKFEKEEEFIRSCIGYLKDASILLPISCNRSLSIIERAVVLLKSYIEVFCGRYSYFFRTLKLTSNHYLYMHRTREKNEPVIRILATSPFNDKNTFDLFVLDYIGDLRAEIQHWWHSLQKENGDNLICLVSSDDHEIPFDWDDKRLLESGFKDVQLNSISFKICKQTLSKASNNLSLSKEFFEEFKLKNPKNLLLERNNFELLFILMQQLEMINNSNLKAQILSRNIWEIILMLPTSYDLIQKFQMLQSNYIDSVDKKIFESNTINDDQEQFNKLYHDIFSSNSNQKLIYACHLVENYKKLNKHWQYIFFETGGVKFLYKLFVDTVSSVKFKYEWTEWKQDCLATLLQVLFHFAIIKKEDNSNKFDCENTNMVSCSEHRKNKRLRKNSLEKNSIMKFNTYFIDIIDDKEKLIDTILTILNYVFLNSKISYQTSMWSRGQVVSLTLTFFTSWCYTDPFVFDMFFESRNIKDIIKKLILNDADPTVRKESCTVFNRLFISFDAQKCILYLPKFLNILISFIEEASFVNISENLKRLSSNEEKKLYSPGCKDYFMLLCRLLELLFSQKFIQTNEIDPDHLSKIVQNYIFTRENFELRKNLSEDEGLKGLFSLLNVLFRNKSQLKSKKENKDLIIKVFNCLFELPTLTHKELPKCKNINTRMAVFEFLLELVKGNEDNYVTLTNLLIDQHRHELLGRTLAYPWEYWPHEESRSEFVGLTNLGATCYMASCMQHIFMLNEVRNAILTTNLSSVIKHEAILRELQKMFIFLQESERKAYNPKNFCKVYTMNHQPLNICEQKDMTEFFTDVITKLEEMNGDLKDVVKKHFSGLQSNNVVSLDCPHISQTMEEFYTLRCQVADMRDLYESLNELTIKDTLEGDNMYNCSECGKKVRAEKRACIKKLPKILCFNTMRYTFNMITMTKEKVNTHFSFPLTLDMAPYLEKNLLNLPAEANRFNEDYEVETSTKYELIGVTVHTGTAEGGHYYSFIQDCDPHSSTRNKWFFFNDAEVKLFDKNQIASECFGGENISKTYDKTNNKYMDFSYEKTNSAYMLFYEKCGESDSKLIINDNSFISYDNISQDLIDWIWNDNISFIRDKLIFDHPYFDFIWRVCAQIPQSYSNIFSNKVTLISTKLATLFLLETLIHAKEKPTIANWIELLTKQFNNSRNACEWLMNHLSENDWLSIQILFKCSNQMVRQLFLRLCIHVISKLKPNNHQSYYLHSLNSRMSNNNNRSSELYTCVSRYIRRLVSLIDTDQVNIKPNIKNLHEYFSFLFDFAKQGDEECRFLLSIDTISIAINFYLNNGKTFNDFSDSISDNEDDEFDERSQFRPVLENPKLDSLEKMIALLVYLIDKTQNRNSNFVLSKNDFESLVRNNFQFIQQQIRDNINLRHTFNLICSICHLEDSLFPPIVDMIFQSIVHFSQDAQTSNLYFKILSFIAETSWISPYFSQLVLPKIWELAEHNSLQTLDWIIQHVSRNKNLYDHVISSLDQWVLYFLVDHSQPRVRSSAATLLISLVPSVDNSFRQNYRPFRSYPYIINKEIILNEDSYVVIDRIFSYLLGQAKKLKIYTDTQEHGTQKLTNYFYVLTYLMINTENKIIFVTHFNDFWSLFQSKLSEPPIAIHHNKQAFIMFWYIACQECNEAVKCIVQNAYIYKKIAFNYILADHEDQDVVLFNKNMLPYYYALLRICCENSRTFTRYLATHQNIQWAFKNITPHMNHYMLAVQELFALIRIFSKIPEDACENEIKEIINFKTTTLKLYFDMDPSVHWGTIINVLNNIIDSTDDHLFLIRNNGFTLLFQIFSSLHIMFHQATACHITNELVEVLKIISSLLTTFENNFELLTNDNYYKAIDYKKLLFLLNTYTPAALRNALYDVLFKLIKMFPYDYIMTTVKCLLWHHKLFVQNGYLFNAGPYFPKQGQKMFQTKSSHRPLRPIFQMCFHVTNLESLSTDDEYKMHVYEFYQPYYLFVEQIVKFAVAKNLIFSELIDLSVKLACESLYFHNKNFIQMWMNFQDNEEDEASKKIVNYLYHNKNFINYLKLILEEERTFLNDDQVYQFMQNFFNKVTPPINTTLIRNKFCALIEKFIYTSPLMKEKKFIDMITSNLLAFKLINNKPPEVNFIKEQFRTALSQLRQFFSDYYDFLIKNAREEIESQMEISDEPDDNSETSNSSSNNCKESHDFLFDDEDSCYTCNELASPEDVMRLLDLIDNIFTIINAFKNNS